MFPVDAAKHPETVRRHALKVGEALGERATTRPEVTASAVVVTEAAALWDSLCRIGKTTVEWEDEDHQGISALVSEALMNKRYRETGKIY